MAGSLLNIVEEKFVMIRGKSGPSALAITMNKKMVNFLQKPVLSALI